MLFWFPKTTHESNYSIDTFESNGERESCAGDGNVLGSLSDYFGVVELHRTIKKVLQQMKDDNVPKRLKDFFQMCGIESYEEYIRVLRVNLAQSKVFLQRTLEQRNVNPFNYRIISLWVQTWTSSFACTHMPLVSTLPSTCAKVTKQRAT